MRGDVPGSELQFKWRGWSHLPFDHTAHVPTTGPKNFPELLDSIHKEGFWKPVLELPIIDIFPGTQTAKAASETVPSEKFFGYSLPGGVSGLVHALRDDPTNIVLDLAPVAHEGSKLLTRGSDLSEEAAQHAEDIGFAGRAAKYRKSGLPPLPATGAVYRRVERKIEGKFPKVHGYLPTDLLRKSGLGGAQMRHLMRMIGEGRSHHMASLNSELTRLSGMDKKFGMKTADIERVTSDMVHPYDNWRTTLKDGKPRPANEVKWIQWIDSETKFLKEQFPQEFFSWGGEDFLRSQHPAFAKTVDSVNKALTRLDQLRQQMLTETDPAKLSKIGRFYNQWLPKYEERTLKAWEQFGTRPPAKYMDLTLDHVRAREMQLLEQRSGGNLDPHTQEMISSGMYEDAGISKAEHDALRREEAAKWQDYRHLDPSYVHHVAYDEAGDAARPRLITRITKPNELKARAWDMRPWIENASVAVSHQWADYVHYLETQRLSETMKDSSVVLSREDMMAETQRWAKLMKQAGDKRSYDLLLDNLRSRYMVYDPRSLFPREGGVGSGGRGDFYIPKELARALEQMRPKDNFLNVSSVVGRGMAAGAHLFRLSYLYFRPFYYVHVLASGAVLTLARGGPRDLLMLPEALHALMTGDYGKFPSDLGLGTARMGAPEENRFIAGGALGDKMLHDYGQMGDARYVARRVEHFTHSLASSAQDMWKAASYLAEMKRASRNLSTEEAMSLAVEHANKVFGTMDDLTPFERTVVRQVLPFYAWSKHLVQYVVSYPFDHPWRAAIANNLGQAVLEDWAAQKKDLPARYMTYFWLGQNKKGEELLFPASGLFPFVQVADMFNFAGFMSRMDPRLQAVLESRGVDPTTGGPIPDWQLAHRFDERLGKEVPVLPSLPSELAKTMIGQADPLLFDDNLKAYYAQHPDRLREALFRAWAGISPMWRDIPTQQKAFQRQQQFTALDERKRLRRQHKTAASSSGYWPK
jgi:hypothetical protein